MIRNYLLIAWRNFQRQKMFALLNVFGLALGLASAILIFLYVNDELSYDTMHPRTSDTYRVGTTFTNRDGQVFNNTVAPGYMLKYAMENRSEVESMMRVDYIGYPTSLHHKPTDKIILTEEIKWVEPDFHKVVAFSLAKGNIDKMFENYNTMIISEAGAKRIFGDRDPIGEVLTIKHNFATRGREIDVVITGIFDAFPSNSHFKANYLVNINALRSVIDNFDNYMEGPRFNDISFFESYLVMKPGADVKAVEQSLTQAAKIMVDSDSAARAQGFTLTAFVRNVRDLHFDPDNLWENDSTRGDKMYLAIFSGVAVMILLIACINYMNLATARAARRAREVGLRKSLGSERRQIAKQFFYESFIMTGASLVFAFLLVIVFLQPFNDLAHKSFTVISLFNPIMLVTILAIVFFMALLSGSYPAIYLSAFKPAEVLKGQLVRGRGAELFRKGLVTVQYAVAMVLIIATFVVIRQMNYMQHTKLNSSGGQLLSIRYGGIAPQDKFEVFRQSVLQDKDIEHVTMANHLPRLDYFGFVGVGVRLPEFENKEMDWNQLNVDFEFPKTYDLELVAGRDFDPSNLADSSSVIINEAAFKTLGQPLERVLGSVVEERFYNQALDRVDYRQLKVIGVVKDFPFKSMHQAIEPLMLNPHVHFIDRIAYVKLPAGNIQEKIASIENKWKEIYPGIGFDYWFVSDEFNRMYFNERKVSDLAKVFAALAVLITVLGVFGLASYTAEQKTKEVGIRKVLGAQVRQVVALFLGMFIKIFLIASLIAIPLAWYLTNNWLESFVYRPPLAIDLFITAVAGLLLLTIATVSYEVVKAAVANPVKSLRND
jgi:putative ABC transport system permease protein